MLSHWCNVDEGRTKRTMMMPVIGSSLRWNTSEILRVRDRLAAAARMAGRQLE